MGTLSKLKNIQEISCVVNTSMDSLVEPVIINGPSEVRALPLGIAGRMYWPLLTAFLLFSL